MPEGLGYKLREKLANQPKGNQGNEQRKQVTGHWGGERSDLTEEVNVVYKISARPWSLQCNGLLTDLTDYCASS